MWWIFIHLITALQLFCFVNCNDKKFNRSRQSTGDLYEDTISPPASGGGPECLYDDVDALPPLRPSTDKTARDKKTMSLPVSLWQPFLQNSKLFLKKMSCSSSLDKKHFISLKIKKWCLQFLCSKQNHITTYKSVSWNLQNTAIYIYFYYSNGF